jgi:hypothetical protein
MLSGGIVGLCLVLGACEQPLPPRSFQDFMDDRIAREGTLTRCDEDREAANTDIECANARRASASIALRLERERREEFERESERKMAELRLEMRERERIAREAALEAARAEREAYEAIFRERNELIAPGLAPAGQPEAPADRLSLIQLSPDLVRE